MHDQRAEQKTRTRKGERTDRLHTNVLRHEGGTPDNGNAEQEQVCPCARKNEKLGHGGAKNIYS